MYTLQICRLIITSYQRMTGKVLLWKNQCTMYDSLSPRKKCPEERSTLIRTEVPCACGLGPCSLPLLLQEQPEEE